jgi:hypothetical protein
LFPRGGILTCRRLIESKARPMLTECTIYCEQAVEWALSMLGSTDYPAKCLAFVEDAYELGNGIVLDGYATAKEAATGYGASDPGGIPPKGAFVFYDCWGQIKGDYANWGHVGLSAGDGSVIHTWGAVRRDGTLEVQELGAPGWSNPVYLGWVPPQVILRGMAVREMQA